MPAVALLGPRQVGKTTQAQMVAESRSALYLDLENPEDLLELGDPTAFLSFHADKLMIENILSVLSGRTEAYFYRTPAGAEIDLLLKLWWLIFYVGVSSFLITCIASKSV
ncbi:MAG: hypothetical protein GY808_09390 [Gammaproteobacteria bacterium]|nr:hypothetical protein [Gammaproteobacteria bacterium]